MSTEAKEQLKGLLSAIDSLVDSPDTTTIGTSDPIKLMFYFNEASSLTQAHGPPNTTKNCYDILHLSFNTFQYQPLFIIFLSTSSQIEALAPSGPMAPSAHARANAGGLQAPITEVFFDCSEGLPIEPHQYKLQEVCDVAFMAKFGRPL